MAQRVATRRREMSGLAPRTACRGRAQPPAWRWHLRESRSESPPGSERGSARSRADSAARWEATPRTNQVGCVPRARGGGGGARAAWATGAAISLWTAAPLPPGSHHRERRVEDKHAHGKHAGDCRLTEDTRRTLQVGRMCPAVGGKYNDSLVQPRSRPDTQSVTILVCADKT